MTLDEVIRMDPMVGRMLDNVRVARGELDWHREYTRNKRLLARCVGFFADDGAREALCGNEAYEVVMADVERRLNGRRRAV